MSGSKRAEALKRYAELKVTLSALRADIAELQHGTVETDSHPNGTPLAT